jgi:hypothetical protein
MEVPTMFPSQSVAEDTEALVSYFPLPGMGLVPINAFLIRGVEPVLVDTGIAGLREDFMRTLRSLIDPDKIRWIWLTHTDPDHVGSIRQVLEEAPRARIITTFLGMGKMALLQYPIDRVYLLNPGQSLDLPDRQLIAVKPPTFDAPETTGFFDTKTRSLFSADCFGALMEKPAETAAAIPASALRDGQILWSTVDAPWLRFTDKSAFEGSVKELQKLDPARIISNHLPPASGMNELLYGNLINALAAPPFVGPDQAAMEKMMQQPQSATKG